MILGRLLDAWRWRWTDWGDRLAEAVAAACHPLAWDRCWEVASTMGLKEARGYVQARSIHLVAAQSERVLYESGLGPHCGSDLTCRASHLVVNAILSELLRTEIPLPAYRRAA